MDIINLNKLHDEGTLGELYKAGFLSPKIFMYREIYLWVDAQCRTRNISQEKAIEEAQIKFDRGRTSICKAIYIFKNVQS